MSHEVNNHSGITNGTLVDLKHKFGARFDRYNDMMCKTLYMIRIYFIYGWTHIILVNFISKPGVKVCASLQISSCMYKIYTICERDTRDNDNDIDDNGVVVGCCCCCCGGNEHDNEMITIVWRHFCITNSKIQTNDTTYSILFVFLTNLCAITISGCLEYSFACTCMRSCE